ncbi:MAG: YXWGXW repeat-containing protein [Planctomycetes bacterium]|nr:YXWGXW repeat-containing protein [Planctomycetota bacterium]
MLARFAKVFGVVGLFGLCLLGREETRSQEPAAQNAQAPNSSDGAVVPKGLEVQARGPIHEAFATPTSDPKPTPPLAKKPPAPVEEMPPEEKPDGDVVWIGGYWALDDDRNDFLWVSGCWRAKPQGKDWVPGYWREQGVQWQWVPGFWRNVTEGGNVQDVTYYPEPPAPPNIAAPGNPPAADMLYVPGYWSWVGDHYVWRAGYWTRARAGWVYVPSHYRWTPSGYIFVGGYWDYSLSRRGVLYAPVVVDTVVVGPRFVYTPYYAVTDTIVLDAFFIRPAYHHYYFGDYYGPRYSSIGFESTIVYSRRGYDSLVVYQRWEYRDNPRWYDTQINLVIARDSGRAPVPPRTLVQQNTVINNVTNVTNVTNVNNTNVTNVSNNVTNNVSKTQVLAPAKSVVAARGGKTVTLAQADRVQAKQATQAVQHAALSERIKTETVAPGTPPPTKPRTAAINVPTQPNNSAAALPGNNTKGSNAGNTLGKTGPTSGTTTNAAGPGNPGTSLPHGQDAGKTAAGSDPTKTKGANATTTITRPATTNPELNRSKTGSPPPPPANRDRDKSKDDKKKSPNN